MKEHVYNPQLKGIILDILTEKSKKRKTNPEDFSFDSIKKEIENKYQIDEKELIKSLDELETEEKIIVKERSFYVYIPSQFEDKFRKLAGMKAADAFFIIISYLLGFFVIVCLFNIFPINVALGLKDPNSALITFVFIFAIPFFVGVFLLVFLKKIYGYAYSNIEFFREMIDFFGGAKVWKYALILSIVLFLLYAIISYALGSKIDPNYATTFSGGTFLVVLGFGAAKSYYKKVITRGKKK